MNIIKEQLIKVINELNESDLEKLMGFMESIKETEETKVNESSLDFWDNKIDDEVWNNV